MNKKGLLMLLVSGCLTLILLSACAKPATPAPAPTTTQAAPTTKPAAPAPTTTQATPTSKPTTPAPTTTQATPASKAADFYKSNKITFLVGYAAGAKTDIISRAIQPFYQAQTGGTVQVDNNGDGGGIVARNITYNAKPDGLTIGVTSLGGMWGDFFANATGVQYDATKARYLGGFGPSGFSLLVNSDSTIRSVDDLKKAQKLKFAGLSPNSLYSVISAIVVDALQLDAQVITGYKGAADAYQALKSGEVDVMVTSSAIAVGYYTQKTARFLFTIGAQREKTFYADVPALAEAAKLSTQHQGWVEFIEKAFVTTTMFFTAPSVPEDNVKYLRSIFDKVSADKAAISALDKAFQGFYTGYGSGEQTEKNLKRVQELKAGEVMKTFASLVDKYRKK